MLAGAQGLLRALCWCPGLEAGKRLELLSLLLDDVNQPHRRDSGEPNGHSSYLQHLQQQQNGHHVGKGSGSGSGANGGTSSQAAMAHKTSPPPPPPPSVDVDDVDPRDGCTVLHRLLAAGTLPVSRGVDALARKGAEQATLAVAATLLQVARPSCYTHTPPLTSAPLSPRPVGWCAD